jgi:two-component system, OmpR family, alkaline phosphatase synthesis response regulator PhoP
MKRVKNEVILYADAKIEDKGLFQSTFEQEGIKIDFVENGDEVVAAVEALRPTILLLEVVLPHVDGIEICSELRKREEFKEMLIFFVSERSEDFIQIAALDAGGDDYLLKPIRPRLLFSHIKAFKRRIENLTPIIITGNPPTSKSLNEIHPILDIDLVNLCAYVHGKAISLPRKQLDILELLLSNPGKVFTRETMMKKLWENENQANTRLIDVHIRKLRRLIGDHFIVTFKGIGYKVVF